MPVFALIPAAGSGSRFAGEQPKQYARLAGKAMLWHSVRAVCVPPVESVFVVLARDDRSFAAQDWSAFDGKVQPLYCGGEARRDSVYNGLVSVMNTVDADDWILVHDAARPCLPRRDLDSLLRECQPDAVGGLLALPVAETVKKAAKDEAGVQRIAGTEDRAQLWLAQTPQMFRAGLLAQALRRATGPVTDEASAIEAHGLAPKLVRGALENFKLTFPADFALAERLLRSRST